MALWRTLLKSLTVVALLIITMYSDALLETLTNFGFMFVTTKWPLMPLKVVKALFNSKLLSIFAFCILLTEVAL